MKRSTEAVGDAYDDARLRDAQTRAWKALEATAAEIRVGHTEKDASVILKAKLKSEGVEKIWHPPQIRFGPNTVKAFGQKGEPTTLRENDLFFLDIGPVFQGHEGDVGRTYTVGTDSTFETITRDSREIFELVREKWAAEALTGPALYEYARELAKGRGWVLSLAGASGHRVGDFPHAVHYRGLLKTQDYKVAPNRWILEIHLLDPNGRFGAFHEDLL